MLFDKPKPSGDEQREYRVRCPVCSQVFTGSTDDEAYQKFNSHYKQEHHQ